MLLWRAAVAFVGVKLGAEVRPLLSRRSGWLGCLGREREHEWEYLPKGIDIPDDHRYLDSFAEELNERRGPY